MAIEGGTVRNAQLWKTSLFYGGFRGRTLFRELVDSEARSLKLKADREGLELVLRVDGSSYARLDIALLLGAATGQDFGEDVALWSGWWRAQVARRPRPVKPVTDERRTGTGQIFRAHRVLFLVDASASMNQVGADGKSRQQKQVETMREFIRAASRGMAPRP